MAFQIDEKMMASNRAIITRNLDEKDLLITDAIKFKPGMMHYISENQKLYLSIDPIRQANGSVKTISEMITELRLAQILEEYVHREGGAPYSLRGALHSIVEDGTAPFIMKSETKVEHLNADMVDDLHVNVASAPNTIVSRDENMNISIGDKIAFDTGSIKKSLDGLHFLGQNREPADIHANTVFLNGVQSSVIEAGPNGTCANTGRMEWKDNSWQVGTAGSTSKIITKSMYGHGNGIDADKVDGKHVDDSVVSDKSLWTSKKVDEEKAPRGYGLGTDINTIPDNDCNSVTGTSFYAGVNPKNGVRSESGDALLETHVGINFIEQEIKYKSSGNRYGRICRDGQWEDWEKVITSNNILSEGINIILSETAPIGIANENTYWCEIIE